MRQLRRNRLEHHESPSVGTVADRLNAAERSVARHAGSLDSVSTKDVNDEEDWQQVSLSVFEKEWDNEEGTVYLR